MIGERVAAIRAVRLVGADRARLATDEPVDVILADGRIVDIAPTGALRLDGPVIDGDGCWAVPGLWDHHVHALQWALASERTDLYDTASAEEAARRMADAPVLADGRRVGTGYRDALWPEPPTLAVLDAVTGATPTYLVNADVHSVWLNSAALTREAMIGDHGVLREEDAFEISRRLNAVEPSRADRAVLEAGRRAAARGVTGIVDFDLSWNVDAWARRGSDGMIAHRVEASVYSSDLDRAVDAGLRTGDPIGDSALVRVGPLKIIADGALGTRTAACEHPYPDGGRGRLNCSPAELDSLLLRAAGAGLAAAVHAIGDRAASVVLDAFARTGAAGSIEHAQLLRHADLSRMAHLGVVASVQPQHAVDDRPIARRLWAAQTSVAYPSASLLRAGAQVRLGSDAPVAPLDPWQAMAAAMTPSGATTAGERSDAETLSFAEALGASVRTEIRPGSVADIVLCEQDPATADVSSLARMPVLTTVLAGTVTHAV